MFAFFEALFSIFGSAAILLTVMSFSFLYKLFILLLCLKYSLKTSTNRLLSLLFTLFLLGALIDDACYITSITLRRIYLIDGNIGNLTFICRLGWSLFMSQFQAATLFFEVLINKKIRLTFLNVANTMANIFISSCFLYLAFFNYHVSSLSPKTFNFEIGLIKAAYLYLLVLFIPTFYTIYKKIYKQELPSILARQLIYLTKFIGIFLLIEALNNRYSFIGFLLSLFSIDKYAFFSLTTIACTYSAYYVSRKVMGMRFLNIGKNVESKTKFDFLLQFKDILEQLSSATVLKELTHISAIFFQAAFTIPTGKTKLYIRNGDLEIDSLNSVDYDINTKVEHFISNQHNQEIIHELKKSKIFIRDEIDFSHFFEGETRLKNILDFLDSIQADIFLPIFEKNTITSYIIVTKRARTHKLFTGKERDEMLIFTSYLSNTINSLKHSNMESLHQQCKELTEEVFLKHQEINQYKESFRSFMRSSNDRKIGIVFYKSRRFRMANEAARELVPLDINANLGHPLTQSFRTVAQRVEEYKTQQSIITNDTKGQKIVIAGVPSLEDSAIILHVYYPEISDIMKSQLGQLKDPSAWDFLLYLETTKSGQLINQLIPSINEELLSFKIGLLSAALSKKALLLEIPEDDLLGTVELLHTISLRKILHVLKLSSPEKDDNIGLTLYGLNPLMQKEDTPPLLEKLDMVGTLFIENVEYLSLKTQDTLASYIAYGFFHKLKSESKAFSAVRIICSTNKDLASLVQDGTFSKALLNELQKTHVAMPSLNTLTPEEISKLAHEYAEQISLSKTLKNLLNLTEKDTGKLSNDRPLSLSEFRERVNQLLVQKSAKHNISEITEFNAAYNISDPDIAQAVSLGKKALKDPKVMAMLWNKLKSQNKIATLLGVNRSSVNRRCTEFGLK